MFLYLYMVVQMILSFLIVGIFYGVFSIFLRATLPSNTCDTIDAPANAVDAIYLVFLFLVLLVSTMIEITWVENTYRVCSFFMGLWSIFMVANSIVYVTETSIESLGVVFLFIYLLSFALPLITNITHLRVCDFIKGCLYCVYLSPTYVNLITIYAISNIHDVSWGSRETLENPIFKVVERKRDIQYKNFRSNFLIFWAIVNIAAGYAMRYFYSSGASSIILYMGVSLTAVMVFRIFVSLIHRIKANMDKMKVKKLIKSRSSKVFEKASKEDELKLSDVFSVYYDEGDDEMKIEQSSKKIEFIAQAKLGIVPSQQVPILTFS